MAKPSVYLETSIISYLAARPSRDLVIAAHQELTWEWWRDRRTGYDAYISQAVIEEATQGDPGAASRRRTLMADLRRAPVTPDAISLAIRLVDEADLPSRAGVDALHIAVAATEGIGVLLTWNCKHMASVTFRPRIELACRALGVMPPVICTPLELLEH